MGQIIIRKCTGDHLMQRTTLDTTAALGYLETTGRRSGLPRETEIWWAQDEDRIYLLSGGGLDKAWIRNFQTTARVRFRVHDVWVSGRASVVDDPVQEFRARELLAARYYEYIPGTEMELPNEWSRTAIPVVITLENEQ